MERFLYRLSRSEHADAFILKGALPDSTPLSLTPAFHSSAAKQAQWRAYLRKGRIQGGPELAEVADHIESFAMPVVASLLAGRAFTHHWRPTGPWEKKGT